MEDNLNYILHVDRAIQASWFEILPNESIRDAIDKGVNSENTTSKMNFYLIRLIELLQDFRTSALSDEPSDKEIKEKLENAINLTDLVHSILKQYLQIASELTDDDCSQLIHLSDIITNLSSYLHNLEY